MSRQARVNKRKKRIRHKRNAEKAARASSEEGRRPALSGLLRKVLTFAPRK